jgi:hypothetical protein
MDKLERYRSLVKQILNQDAQYKPSHGDVEPMVICDEASDHYELMYLGWDPLGRVHSVIVHVRLHNGKIWIEYDGTEYGIARELTDAGVPKEDIVLAFHPPEMRPHTGFAVA